MSRSKRTTIRYPLLAVLLAFAAPAGAQNYCGSSETVEEGETLEQLADRCGTTAEAVLSANPDISADEVDAGTRLAMPEAEAEQEGGWLERARDAVRRASDEVEEAATGTGRSVSDYLRDNPDLSRDIRDFGERVGVPGFATSPTGDGQITVAAVGGPADNEVRIHAQGLPENAQVVIGAGPPESEYEELTRATTDASGELETVVTLPQDVQAGEEVVFVVETEDGEAKLVSDPFEVQ